MSLDPYSLCPCESGKKLKFCCLDIANDMVKALQLHESGQSKAALKILVKLHGEHPARAWVSTSLAGVYLYLEDPAAAREVLAPLLKESPDHPLGRILDATAALDMDGYDKARSAIHRAFTKGVKEHPEMVGSLAAGIAASLYEEERFLAARQHLTLGMRFVRDQDRQQVFMRLLDFDGDQSVPYPLRGVHNLRRLELDDEDQTTFKKALGLSSLGCWHEAAQLATKLTEKYADDAELWYNIGLFHAWDGDQESSAKAMHKASELADDREFAVSCQTVAQLFDLEANRIEEELRYYRFNSTLKLRAAAEQSPRFQIHEVKNDDQVPGESLTWLFLDKAPPEEVPEMETQEDLEQFPISLGYMTIIDVPEKELNGLVRLSVQNEYLDEFRKQVFEMAEEGEPDEIEPNDAYDSPYSQWSDYRNLYQQYHLPVKAPADLRAKLGKLNWEKVIQKEWPQRPLTALDGKSPAEVKGNEDYKIRLAAAINIFDSMTDSYNHQIDLNGLLESYGLEPQQEFKIQDDNQLNACEVLEMLRIDPASLNDQQLESVLNRTQLIQHARFTEIVLAEVIKREQIVDDRRMAQVWHAYIDIARDKYDRDAALERIGQAKEWAKNSSQKLEEALQWEMRELQFRVVDKDDPALTEFLNNMHRQYLRKLPDLETLVTSYLQEHGITPPWDNTGKIVTAGSMQDAEAKFAETGQQAGGSGKLWLPGQD